MYNAGALCYGRSMKDLTRAPGANLVLNVLNITRGVDVYEMLFVRRDGDAFVPVFNIAEDDEPAKDFAITEENLPVLVQAIEDLRAVEQQAKADGNQRLEAEASCCVPELFIRRTTGYNGKEITYWTDDAPELRSLFGLENEEEA